MTKLLFYQDTYLMDFETTLMGIKNNGYDVFLSETCFYPEGGGQPSDKGVLEIDGKHYKVTSVRVVGDVIYHTISEPALSDLVGARVLGRLDEKTRMYHMRHHTALHLLNTYMLNNFNVRVTGGQVGSLGEPSRHDFELDRGLTPEERCQLETWVNNVISENRLVKARAFTEEEIKSINGFCRTRNVEFRRTSGGVRGVEIEGIDIQACGGTHVGTTGEIGNFSIQKIDNKGANLRRIKIMLA